MNTQMNPPATRLGTASGGVIPQQPSLQSWACLVCCRAQRGRGLRDDASRPQPQPAAHSVRGWVPCRPSGEDTSVSLCHNTATTHPSFPFHVLEVRLDSRRCAEPSLPGGPRLHLPLLSWGNDKALRYGREMSEWEE